MTRRRGDEEILPFMVPRPSTAPVRRTGRSSPVRPMRPESGQPYTQSLSRSSSSPVSTVSTGISFNTDSNVNYRCKYGVLLDVTLPQQISCVKCMEVTSLPFD